MPDIPADSIVSKTLYHDEAVKVIVFGFDVGQSLSEHTSAKPAILHFLQGEAQVTLADETHKAQAGTWVYMPPHIPHSIDAQTPVIMLLEMLGG